MASVSFGKPIGPLTAHVLKKPNVARPSYHILVNSAILNRRRQSTTPVADRPTGRTVSTVNTYPKFWPQSRASGLGRRFRHLSPPPTGSGALRAQLNGNSRRLEQRDPTGPPHHSDGSIPSRIATMTASRRLMRPASSAGSLCGSWPWTNLGPNSDKLVTIGRTPTPITT